VRSTRTARPLRFKDTSVHPIEQSTYDPNALPGHWLFSSD
jgi:hypothetical protein